RHLRRPPSFPPRRSSDLVPLEHDLDLVLLDRPPAHRREPPETPSPLRHDPTPAVDQGAPPWRRELLVLLGLGPAVPQDLLGRRLDRKSTRLNSSHVSISY